MKIAILGANGQVGFELQNSLRALGDIVALDRTRADLSKFTNVIQVLTELQPDVIINAAAYTAVDKAEEEQDLAMLVNGEAPGVIAKLAKQLNALLIHYSTDYIFDGEKSEPYTEDDEPNPLNIYGSTKLAGEQAIQKAGGYYLIFRTSWVYSLHGHNFLKTILRLASEREELKIVNDQIGAPTWAKSIADITAHIIPLALNKKNSKQFHSQLYHLVSRGQTSWHDFAKEIVKLAQNDNRWKIKVKNILPQPTSAYPTPAKRPMYSVLSTEKISNDFSIELPLWQEALANCLKAEH